MNKLILIYLAGLSVWVYLRAPQLFWSPFYLSYLVIMVCLVGLCRALQKAHETNVREAAARRAAKQAVFIAPIEPMGPGT